MSDSTYVSSNSLPELIPKHLVNRILDEGELDPEEVAELKPLVPIENVRYRPSDAALLCSVVPSDLKTKVLPPDDDKNASVRALFTAIGSLVHDDDSIIGDPVMLQTNCQELRLCLVSRSRGDILEISFFVVPLSELSSPALLEQAAHISACDHASIDLDEKRFDGLLANIRNGRLGALSGSGQNPPPRAARPPPPRKALETAPRPFSLLCKAPPPNARPPPSCKAPSYKPPQPKARPPPSRKVSSCRAQLYKPPPPKARPPKAWPPPSCKAPSYKPPQPKARPPPSRKALNEHLMSRFTIPASSPPKDCRLCVSLGVTVGLFRSTTFQADGKGGFIVEEKSRLREDMAGATIEGGATVGLQPAANVTVGRQLPDTTYVRVSGGEHLKLVFEKMRHNRRVRWWFISMLLTETLWVDAESTTHSFLPSSVKRRGGNGLRLDYPIPAWYFNIVGGTVFSVGDNVFFKVASVTKIARKVEHVDEGARLHIGDIEICVRTFDDETVYWRLNSLEIG